MKKITLVLVIALTFTLFAASSAFAVVGQPEPEKGEMAITSVEEGTVDLPTSEAPDMAQSGVSSVEDGEVDPNQPVSSDANEQQDSGVVEDAEIIMAPASSDVAEMAQTGVVEDSTVKKENQSWTYIAGAIVAAGIVGIVLMNRKKTS